MNRSYLGGFLVKPSPTNVTFVIIRFHILLFLLPVRMTLNISASVIGFTLGIGTAYLPAFSLRFCLTELERIYINPVRHTWAVGQDRTAMTN